MSRRGGKRIRGESSSTSSLKNNDGDGLEIVKIIKNHAYCTFENPKLDFNNMRMQWYDGIYGKDYLPVMIRRIEKEDAKKEEILQHLHDIIEVDAAEIHSANILHLYGVVKRDGDWYVATERVSGTLHEYLRANAKDLFMEESEAEYDSVPSFFSAYYSTVQMKFGWRMTQKLLNIVLTIIHTIDALEGVDFHLHTIKLHEIYVVGGIDDDDVTVKLFYGINKGKCDCKNSFKSLISDMFHICARCPPTENFNDLVTLNRLPKKLNWKMLCAHPVFLKDWEKLRLLNDAALPPINPLLDYPNFIFNDEYIGLIPGAQEECKTFPQFICFMRHKIEHWDDVPEKTKLNIGNDKKSIIQYLEKNFPGFLTYAFTAKWQALNGI